MYDTVGVFSVSLVVTNTWNCQDSVIKNNLITIHGRPSPRFLSDTLWGCVLLLTHFSDLSLPYPPSPITSWNWNFGNGNTSTLQNPSCNYSSPGNFTVSLTITDQNGCDSTLTKPLYINITRPMTGFTVDSITCFIDYRPHFTNTSTGVAPLSYSWNFGDGSPLSTNVNPSHIYTVPGSTMYTVSLTTTDGNGCDSSVIKQIKISRPIVNFASDTTTSRCSPLFVFSFADSSSTDVVSWQWNFGDTLSGFANDFLHTNPQHVFNYAGTYDITLIVTNTDGCTDTCETPLYQCQWTIWHF